MLKHFFIVNSVLLIFTIYSSAYSSALASALIDKLEKKPIIITSQTLIADSKNNIAIFEGSVTAKTNNLSIYSDKMTVFYDSSESKVKKIHAVGNVKVVRDEKALFSDEATYVDEEAIIIFEGNPKAVEGENVITGTQIIFYLEEDRAVVKGSRVVLQNKRELN